MKIEVLINYNQNEYKQNEIVALARKVKENIKPLDQQAGLRIVHKSVTFVLSFIAINFDANQKVLYFEQLNSRAIIGKS